MKVLKFGGRSLATDKSFSHVINIIRQKSENNQIAVVVSAIGDTTDTLERILELAKNRADYRPVFEEFMSRPYHLNINLNEEFKLLNELFGGVYLLEDYSLKVKDQILAQGEIISGKALSKKLVEKGLKAIAVDSREFIVTDENFGNAQTILEISETRTRNYFRSLKKGSIPVVTGFIGRTEKGETSTLGRNGSNYSASLLAGFLNAEELQNYTHVDGIFTANPDWVVSARRIEELSFDEANEMAKLGASILHSKTILPLVEKKIPLRVLNTLNPDCSGTLISSKCTGSGIKTISLNTDTALVKLEGRGLLGKPGVDARIFGALARKEISVSVISQGSSERGLGFVVSAKDAEAAEAALKKEFQNDFVLGDVSGITIDKEIAVLSVVGQDLSTFDKPYSTLVRNKIIPVLFNNTVSGKNVSLVIEKSQAIKALNVIHGQIFGVSKTVNIAVFGHGLVGGTLIDQIIESANSIEKRKNFKLNIFAVINSKKALFSSEGIGKNWREEIEEKGEDFSLQKLKEFAEEHHLENLIAVDNTASSEITNSYISLIESGFDLVSSNKTANTLSYDFYKELRKNLNKHHKEYLYEANVGAGLPLIDTIKLLHLSGENITKIKGVFSGSLSYIFNTFSSTKKSFGSILKEAAEHGYTEPDPREDLSGNDVARKLLILARELDLKNEFEEIEIQNLIPEELRSLELPEFFKELWILDKWAEDIKKITTPGHVLKYVGELSGDLSREKGILRTGLIEVPKDSALGQLKGADNIFEIYTESYGKNPIVIRGSGAGALVTARGVFGDILRLADR